MSITKEKQYLSEKFKKKLEKEAIFQNAIAKHNGTFKKEDRKTILMKLEEKYSLFCDFFINDFNTFKYKGYNLESIELQLIEHLFCKYTTTPSLYCSFLILNSFYKDLKKGKIEEKEEINKFLFFLDIANGSSPFKNYTKNFLTKNETHFLFNCKKYKTIEENLMYMFLMNYSFKENFLNAILNSKFKNYIDFFYRNYNSKFYKENVLALKTFFEIIGKYKNDITLNIIEELYDFFNNNRIYFSQERLKGRTLNSLIQLNNEWHIQQIKRKEIGSLEWNKHYKDFEYNINDAVLAQFFELTTSTQLLKEGETQRHCVGSYARECQNGMCSIFATMINSTKGPTIEINNRTRRIVQVKRKFNAKATNEDYKYIKKFAEYNNLDF